MLKKRTPIIVTVLLFALVLGFLSMSGPKPVTGEDQPPIPYGPNGEIPFGYPDPFDEEQIPIGEVETDPSESQPDKDGTENEIMASSMSTSYSSYGFEKGSASYYRLGWGCMENAESNARVAYHSVNIPDGSRIVSIDFSGFDENNGAEMLIDFNRERYSGNTGDLVARLQSGIEYTSTTYFYRSKSLDHIVDNNLYSYYIWATFPAYNASKTVALCQITIKYIPPSPFVNAMPVIINK